MTTALTNHRLAITAKSLVITFAVVALYFQDLSMVFSGALTDESTFHILSIPFIFAYLLYRKRKMFSASLTPNQVSKQPFQRNFGLLAGISLFAVSILTYWYGSYTFIPLEYHMVTLPLMAAGLILILFGLQTLKELIFPVAFLFFLTPPPSEILYGVGSALANLSAMVSNSFANLLGLNSALSSSNAGPVITIIRPDTTMLSFNVSVACSGIYSIIGFVIFAVFIAYITQGKLRNKLAILVMGIPLIIFLNIIRITIILAIGYNWGEELALQVFHTFGATVLMFIGTLILLAVTEKAFKKPPAVLPCVACAPAPKSTVGQFCYSCGKLFQYPKINLNRIDLTKIAGVIIATILLVSIQAPVFALTEGPAEVMTQTPTGTQVNTDTAMFPTIPGYNVRYSYRDSAFEETSGNDAALVYVYSPTDETKPTVWVAVQIGSSSTSQHRWETCLINYPLSQGDQSQVVQLDLHDVQLQDNPPIKARYFAFQYKDTNQTQVVLYWYQTATFNNNGTSQTKSVMMSLVMYPSSNEIEQSEAIEMPIAKAINEYWQPIKTWSTVSLAISENGLSLSMGAAAVLVALIIYALYLNRKEKLSLLTLYRKLPTQNQQLIQAVGTSKALSTQAVTTEFQKLSGASASEESILEKLNEAEAAGLVKKSLRNNRDNPGMLWQSRVPKKRFFIF